MNSEALKAILKWSLKQQDSNSDGNHPPETSDPERMKWLQGALASVSSQPSETDILKAAITVLKVQYENSLSAENKEIIVKLSEAFDQLQYLVEDLDHARDLIPLEGVDAILKYLHHTDSGLVACACEVIATSTQNDEPCQRVFLPAVPRLLTLVNAADETVKVKSLYALSCLTRNFSPALDELLRHGGLQVLIQCVDSKVPRLVSKSLFFLSYLYSSGDEDVLKSEVVGLLERLFTRLSHCEEEDMLSHIVSLLKTLRTKYIQQCREFRKDFSELLQVKLQQLEVGQDLMEEITTELLPLLSQ